MIHFEFSFVKDVRSVSRVFIYLFGCGCLVVPAPFVGKTIFAALYCLCPLSNISWMYLWAHYWALHSILLICLSVLLPVPHCLDYCSFTAKSLQSCPTLCDPTDGGPPGSPVPGILLARTLEWVAISFSNAWKGKVKVKSLSCVRLFATPWSAAYQAPPSMGFSMQEYWSGVPLPSPTVALQ